MQQYPAHLVLAWIGHTAAVAQDHYLKVTDADFDIASGKAAQNPAHSASVRSHQGPSQETESKENPVKASDRKNSIPPAGIQCHKTRRKVYWATVGNRRPNVVSLVIDNKSSFLAGLRPLWPRKIPATFFTTSSVEF